MCVSVFCVSSTTQTIRNMHRPLALHAKVHIQFSITSQGSSIKRQSIVLYILYKLYIVHIAFHILINFDTYFSNGNYSYVS